MPQQANTGTLPEGPNDLDKLATNIIRHMTSPNTLRFTVDTAEWAKLTGQDEKSRTLSSPNGKAAVILQPDPPVLLHTNSQKPALLDSLMFLTEDENRKVILFLTEGQQMTMIPRTTREETGDHGTALGLVAACATADRVEIILRTTDSKGRTKQDRTSNRRSHRNRNATTEAPLSEDIPWDVTASARHNVSGHPRMGRHRLKDGTWRITREWVSPHTRRTPRHVR